MSKPKRKVALALVSACVLVLPSAAAAYIGAAGDKPKQEVPPPTIDTDGDGKPDAWDRDANGVPDAWDTDGDGKPDALDNDGDGKPDAISSDPKPNQE